jgi:hypothetical protein
MEGSSCDAFSRKTVSTFLSESILILFNFLQRRPASATGKAKLKVPPNHLQRCCSSSRALRATLRQNATKNGNKNK